MFGDSFNYVLLGEPGDWGDFQCAYCMKVFSYNSRDGGLTIWRKPIQTRLLVVYTGVPRTGFQIYKAPGDDFPFYVGDDDIVCHRLLGLRSVVSRLTSILNSGRCAREIEERGYCESVSAVDETDRFHNSVYEEVK